MDLKIIVRFTSYYLLLEWLWSSFYLQILKFVSAIFYQIFVFNQNDGFWWRNHAKNVHQKLVPGLFLIWLNNSKQPLHARNCFENKIFWKSITKKSTLFFLPNPVPFNVRSYQKQKGSGTSDQSLFRLRNKFRKIPLLVM